MRAAPRAARAIVGAVAIASVGLWPIAAGARGLAGAPLSSGHRAASPRTDAADVVRPVTANYVSGLIRAPGGLYLRDQLGRAVLFHGVNAVEKNPPYELTVTPGLQSSFTVTDAREIAALGFNVVRLGILWQGLEPGAGGPNDPAVCSTGPPTDPHVFQPRVAAAYLGRIRRVVDLLGRFHVYTLLDMHQDVYSQAFHGEGAPAWALCTGWEPLRALGGRWSANYRNPALNVAVTHFWTNDVVGDLQGEYDRVWATVARSFRNDPWILGYDPYNEPFERELSLDGSFAFATLLECFYTGREHPGRLDSDGARLTCPPGDPLLGVVPTIEAADPHHLVFVEPDIYTIRDQPNLLGSMPFPRLVLNFHAYCGSRSPITGDPTNVETCADQVANSLLRRSEERVTMASRYQRGGPPLFLGEFGATGSTKLVDEVTRAAALLGIGWTYWSWKFYDDPTGSSAEALVGPYGQFASTVSVLSRPFAQAVAGTPVSSFFDPASGTYHLTYLPARVSAPTIVYVPVSGRYQGGYCATANGGKIVSARRSTHLLVDSTVDSRQVDVTIAPAPCRPDRTKERP